MKRLGKWFLALSRLQKSLLLLIALVIGSIAGSSQPQNVNLAPTSDTRTYNQQQTTDQPTITTRTVTEKKTLHFHTQTVHDSSLAQGTKIITTYGVNGSETLTYKITYTNGVQTNKELTLKTITKHPVTQVTTVGSYVAPVEPDCPNGTYVNSAGNTVCSPYSSPSAPAGATAQCGDGSYSFSQSRSGTCSHHGGVATWL
ncbi:MAG TPA: DUF3761 domain-containing protein [Candidatus Saccharimonadales bacterium]|nr:DUF3761 domain-containing protein [Candidatus Saccharimonadales bacterium]